ncbi:MAG TPA: Rid family hydrolase [Sedimentisphaerales bacterium]|nr:Rid family hydrolase [Sedimentisphaerales bacterium]HNU28800.1 Rid family hydrolase [Sedimentisphaerales bacterium]
MTSFQKRVAAGLSVTTVSRDPVQEHFITVTPQKGETPESVFQRTVDAVRQVGGRIVSVEALGLSAADRSAVGVLTKVAEDAHAPLAWIENSRADNLFGVHVWAVSGTSIKALSFNGRPAGTVFDDGHVQYCRLAGLLPPDAKASRPEQAAAVFHQMDVLLEDADMTFGDVLRTWFYNDNILGWYRDFNGVRNKFFQEKKVYEGLLPASTGIGGRNLLGAALLSGLIAIKTDNQDVTAFEVPSPMQSPAPQYGSSFSRAVELEQPDLRRLYVSGTASIDEHGKSVFLDDAPAQVRQTMEVVQAILRSRDMDWGDVTRSLAYFKRAKDAPLFNRYCDENGVPSFPAIIVENDVCRDELLFEIEVDAVVAK